MKRFLLFLDRFFFRKVSASGFGLMRIAWAASNLILMLGSASDVVRYYSDVGMLPRSMWHIAFRSEYRFTLLDWIVSPEPVILLWTAFMLCLVCMMLGIHTRLMTFISVVLLASFHERNVQIINAGDTLFQIIGYILMIAPRIDAFSVDRLRHQYHVWQSTGKLLEPIRTDIWAYRLLLWQFILVYLMSGWAKFHGHMWGAGTAIASTFHHTDYFRFPKIVADYLTLFSPFLSRIWLLYAPLWILLLLPRKCWFFLPKRLQKYSLKRWLLLGGFFFHSCIGFFMDVGAWSIVMQVGLIGLLLDEDFDAVQAFFNSRWTRRYRRSFIIVLYDGSCSLCLRSVFILSMLDSLRRLKLVDFRDEKLRLKYAKDIPARNLDLAVHVRFPNSRTFAGFDAFRELTWHLPLLWLTLPFLYLPLALPLGRYCYKGIAKRRKRCHDGTCKRG